MSSALELLATLADVARAHSERATDMRHVVRAGVHALARAGVPQSDIGRALGIDRRRVWDILQEPTTPAGVTGWANLSGLSTYSAVSRVSREYPTEGGMT